VVIGDNSAIAAYYITDSQNHSLSVDRRSSRVAPVEKKPVVIGRNVWVSVLTTILHGVVIGDNSVIGANSLVTHDIPADWLAYGTPAVPIRRLDGVGEE
jgi:galactoside O-acetyltransferase